MAAGGWDVVVAGAGPGGSRVAEVLAARGLSVALLDPRVPWEKPCGGGLTAAALAHTPALGELRERGRTITEIQVVAPSGASVVVPLRRPYLIVSRFALSAWGLERATAAGARFYSTAIERIERAPGGWRVLDSHERAYHARCLIGADGATSRVRGIVAPGLKPELAPTRVAYTRQGSLSGRAAFLFLPAAQGYVWDFPRTGHHSVGIGIMPGSFGRTAMDGALDQYMVAETGDAESLGRQGAVIATSAWVSGTWAHLGGPDYALVGDAAGLADPATGEGIDAALRSAALAANAFTLERGFAEYPGAARRAFAGERRRALLIRRWLYRPAVAERLVRQARRSHRAAMLLIAVADAINEHGSLTGALGRALFGSGGALEAARAVCDCPDGAGGVAPLASANPEAPTVNTRAS